MLSELKRLSTEQETMRRELGELAAMVAGAAKNSEEIGTLRDRLSTTREEFASFKADMGAKMAMVAVIASAVTSAIVGFLFHILTRNAIISGK